MDKYSRILPFVDQQKHKYSRIIPFVGQQKHKYSRILPFVGRQKHIKIIIIKTKKPANPFFEVL
jgi:hypothetical protein